MFASIGDQFVLIVMFSYFAFAWLLLKAGKAAARSADVRKAAGKGAISLISKMFR